MLKNGIHPDIPFGDYLKIPAVSNSYLGRLDKCPAAAKIEREDTPSLVFGRAVHALALEGIEAFQTRFQCGPDCGKKTKEERAAWAEAETLGAQTGRTILDAESYEKVYYISDAIMSHPWAAKLLTEGVSEQTVLWTDARTGLPCKARPDRVPSEDRQVIVDLKTTADASPQAFTRSAVKYGYARQAAFYLDGLAANSNSATTLGGFDFIFIAVEKTAPFRVEVYALDDLFVDYGRAEYRSLLDVEKKCRETGQYPNWQGEGGITTLFLPTYL